MMTSAGYFYLKQPTYFIRTHTYTQTHPWHTGQHTIEQKQERYLEAKKTQETTISSLFSQHSVVPVFGIYPPSSEIMRIELYREKSLGISLSYAIQIPMTLICIWKIANLRLDFPPRMSSASPYLVPQTPTDQIAPYQLCGYHLKYSV